MQRILGSCSVACEKKMRKDNLYTREMAPAVNRAFRHGTHHARRFGCDSLLKRGENCVQVLTKFATF